MYCVLYAVQHMCGRCRMHGPGGRMTFRVYRFAAVPSIACYCHEPSLRDWCLKYRRPIKTSAVLVSSRISSIPVQAYQYARVRAVGTYRYIYRSVRVHANTFDSAEAPLKEANAVNGDEAGNNQVQTHRAHHLRS